MSKRTASWLAWSMWALSLVLTALSLYLLMLSLSHAGVHIYVNWLFDTLLAIGFLTVGAIVASRRPENPISWLFCIIGLLFAVGHFCGEYAIYTLLAAPGSLPVGEAAAWIRYWIWVPYLGLGVFLFLLVPNGKLPGSRWRWFARLSVLLILTGTGLVAIDPEPIRSLGPIQNPLGIESMPSLSWTVEAVMFALIFVATASLFMRLHYSRGIERQQIKWITYAAVTGISGAILMYTISEATDVLWLEGVGFVLLTIGLVGIPISMGIAILRYRLFEIDLIINRTLVYGLLSVMLGLVYSSSVTGLQYLFSLLTGQGDTLAIVASTLAIAALFNPLRGRIQGFIDRRFYRRKYDAAKTLEAFGARLREETDLEKISDDLVGVVRETMQPSHVTLWLSSFPSSPKRSEISSNSSKQNEPPPH
jgi:hypothetical protein